MKKIATITYHNATNIGAVLQTYALQQAIKQLGADTKVINYTNEYIRRAYRPFFLQRRSITWIIKTLFVAPLRIMRNYRFRKFISDYIETTTAVRTDADFARLNDRYDMFFVGSDQVWNPKLTGGIDGRYFLDFVVDSRKKKSYAASFGFTELPDAYEEKFKKYFSTFSDVSTREPSGVKVVRSLNEKLNPVAVLDPVLLLPSEHWRKLAINPSPKYGKYLLVFCVNGITDATIRESRRIAELRGLKVVCLARRPQRIKGVKVVTNFAPREFLGYVKNAQYVVTDSFHATAFSIIFRKTFSVQGTIRHGEKNNRSLELMDKLGIKKRVLGKEFGDIDWDVVGERLDIERDDSFGFLEECINRS